MTDEIDDTAVPCAECKPCTCLEMDAAFAVGYCKRGSSPEVPPPTLTTTPTKNVGYNEQPPSESYTFNDIPEEPYDYEDYWEQSHESSVMSSEETVFTLVTAEFEFKSDDYIIRDKCEYELRVRFWKESDIPNVDGELVEFNTGAMDGFSDNFKVKFRDPYEDTLVIVKKYKKEGCLKFIHIEFELWGRPSEFEEYTQITHKQGQTGSTEEQVPCKWSSAIEEGEGRYDSITYSHTDENGKPLCNDPSLLDECWECGYTVDPISVGIRYDDSLTDKCEMMMLTVFAISGPDGYNRPLEIAPTPSDSSDEYPPIYVETEVNYYIEGETYDVDKPTGQPFYTDNVEIIRPTSSYPLTRIWAWTEVDRVLPKNLNKVLAGKQIVVEVTYKKI